MTPDRLAEILDVARNEYDVVVVDTPPAFTSTTITAIDNAQHAVMVGTLDLPGLKNMKVGIETLDLMGFDQGRILTVLNRADSKVGLLGHDVKNVLGARPARDPVRPARAAQLERRPGARHDRAEGPARQGAARPWRPHRRGHLTSEEGQVIACR